MKTALLLVLFLALLFERLNELHGQRCSIQRLAHAALAFGLERCQCRLVRFLRHFHRRLLILWLRGLILALKAVEPLFDLRDAFLNFFARDSNNT